MTTCSQTANQSPPKTSLLYPRKKYSGERHRTKAVPFSVASVGIFLVDPGLKSWNRLLDFFVKAYGVIQTYKNANSPIEVSAVSSAYLIKRG